MKRTLGLITPFCLCLLMVTGCGSDEEPEKAPTLPTDDAAAVNTPVLPPPPTNGFDSPDALLAHIRATPTSFGAFEQWSGVTHASTTQATKNIDALSRLMAACDKVDNAVRGAWGDDAGAGNQFAQNIPNFSSATMSSATADRAALNYANVAGVPESDVLIRVAGRWYISADELGSGMHDRLDIVQQGLPILESVASDLARRIKIGRLTSADYVWEQFDFALKNARGGGS